MSPLKFDRTISFGNVLTIVVLVATVAIAGAKWYFGTESLAKDQKRQDAEIVQNKTSAAVNARDIQDEKIKFRGLKVQVDTELRNVYKAQQETNRKLDHLIDLQLRGPR